MNCGQLIATEYCFKVIKYNNGKFDEIFHHHAPKSQLSMEACVNILHGLVIHFSDMNPTSIVKNYQVKRGPRKAGKTGPFSINSEYPESGVQRLRCGSNVIASIDKVIVETKFRQKSSN